MLHLLVIILLTFNIFSQTPGEKPKDFRDSTFIFDSPRPLIDLEKLKNGDLNAAGANVGFSGSGFALGAFYERNIGNNLSLNISFYISEKRITEELEYINNFNGIIFIPNKVNRLYSIPLNFELKYYPFSESLGGSIKPFIAAGTGVGFIMQSPYTNDNLPYDGNNQILNIFSSWGQAQFHARFSSVFDVGMDFRLADGSFSSLHLQYYYIPFGGNGLESIFGNPIDNFGGFIISLNVGKSF